MLKAIVICLYVLLDLSKEILEFLDVCPERFFGNFPINKIFESLELSFVSDVGSQNNKTLIFNLKLLLFSCNHRIFRIKFEDLVFLNWQSIEVLKFCPFTDCTSSAVVVAIETKQSINTYKNTQFIQLEGQHISFSENWKAHFEFGGHHSDL